MMFGCYYNPFCACRFCNAAPLVAIEFFRIKNFSVLRSFSPFKIGKGVRAKMNKEIIFQILPLLLNGRWNGKIFRLGKTELYHKDQGYEKEKFFQKIFVEV